MRQHICYSLAMPDVLVEPAYDTALAVEENGSANGASSAVPEGTQRLANGQFAVGWRGGPGRTPGVRNAAKCLDRAAPKLARHMIARSFKSDTVLCKTMDKILPDAGKESSTVNIALNYAALTIPSTLRSTVKSINASASESSTTG